MIDEHISERRYDGLGYAALDILQSSNVHPRLRQLSECAWSFSTARHNMNAKQIRISIPYVPVSHEGTDLCMLLQSMYRHATQGKRRVKFLSVDALFDAFVLPSGLRRTVAVLWELLNVRE